MISIRGKILLVGALAMMPPIRASEAPQSEEPQFQKLFTRPGVVSEGWVVRNWMEVSEPPKWPVVWEVDADGALHGTGRYTTMFRNVQIAELD
jgi:hypothetical protein